MGSGPSKLRRSSQSAKRSSPGLDKHKLPQRSSSFPVDNTIKKPTTEDQAKDFRHNGSVNLTELEKSFEKQVIRNGTQDQDNVPMANKGQDLTHNGGSEPNKTLHVKPEEASNSLTASEIYNLIIAETWQGFPQIHDPGYMLLLDCRDRESYDTLHIVTARHHTALYSEYGLLLPSQLKLFHVIVLYSSSPSTNLHAFSKKLSEDSVDHFTLRASCDEFLRSYPFLGTTEILSYSSEFRKTLQTMPSEIIPGRLYQGNAKHALDPYIIKTLGVTHIVNVTLEHPNRFDDTLEYMRIQLDDKPNVDLKIWLPKTTAFIRTALGDFSLEESIRERANQNGAVLVHCNLGRSRSSTVVLGYLMSEHNLTLGVACNRLKDCRSTIRPNVGFLDQLLKYEAEIFGQVRTDFNDLPF